MKKFALSVLYMFSIILAVGIGMSQVGKEGSKINGRDVMCPYTSKSEELCTQIPGQTPCVGSHVYPISSESNYRASNEPQCVNWKYYREVHGWNYGPDPRCEPKFNYPESCSFLSE